MEALDPDGGLDQVARTDSRMGIEARRHQCLLGFRLPQDLPGRGRVQIPCDLEHLFDNGRLHVKLDLNHALGAEQLDELHPAAETRTVRRAFGGITEVLGPHTHGDIGAGIGIERAAEAVRTGDRQPLVAENALKRASVALDPALEHIHHGRPDEGRDEDVVRLVVNSLRRAALLKMASAHNGDPGAHRHRLELVVSDVHGRDAELTLEARDLGPHLRAQLRVEVGERFVHQEHLRFPDDRAPHRHPLSLTARERPRLAPQQLVQLEQLRDMLNARSDISLRDSACPKGKRQVVEDAHVRVERVVLEDHRHVPLARVERVDDLVADADLPFADFLESGGHPQRRGLAAP